MSATLVEVPPPPDFGSPAITPMPAAVSEKDRVTAALQLGWRVAELYAQVNDTGTPTNDTLLPGHDSLAPEDQLELQLRAAAGDAHRAGVALTAVPVERLLRHAREAPASEQNADLFRREVRACHVELSKDLWAQDEAAGKAYELGNGVSDTYSRVCRAYRVRAESVSTAWREVFHPERIERLKNLLDELETRLNSNGVAVVRHHLDVWAASVPRMIERDGAPPPLERVREGLRRQTVIWRQLVAGDKQPEAYLDRAARAEIPRELRMLVWHRLRPWVLPGAAALFALALAAPKVIGWYDDGNFESHLGASALAAVGGALGITRASMMLTVRSRMKQWTALLWDRALAKKVSDATLVLDQVFPQPPTDGGAIVHAAIRVRRRARQSITPLGSTPGASV